MYTPERDAYLHERTVSERGGGVCTYMRGAPPIRNRHRRAETVSVFLKTVSVFSETVSVFA